MRRCAVFILLTVFISASDLPGREITLSQQAALDLCSYPSVREGIIDLLYLTVDEFWHRDEYKKIFPVFNLITKISPGEIEAWATGGWFLINAMAPSLSDKEKNNVIENGIEFIESGIKANPQNSRLYREMAGFYYGNGSYDRALYYLEMGERYSHTFHIPHMKAHIYQKKGMNEEALKEWEKIRKNFPEMKDGAERFIEEIRAKEGME